MDGTESSAADRYRIIKQKHGRWWEVRKPNDEMLSRKGAREVVRRLAA